MKTAPDGRFRIDKLVPGLPYAVSVFRKNEPNAMLRVEGYLHEPQWTVKPGELRDWGDIQVKPNRP